MKRMNATLSLASFALMSLIFCKTTFAQHPPDNVEGNWTIYSTNAGNGETEIKHVQIAQYGNRITGYFEGPNQSGPIQGMIDVHHIRFSTVTPNVLTFMGQIYGDSMSGTYGIRGKHAQWQAQRTPPVTQTVPNASVSYSQPVLIPPSPAPAAVSVQQAATQPATDSATQYNSAPAPTPAPLSSDQLNALVAPIALYPDALVAQVLAACANPDQVAFADDWLAQNRSLTGTALAQAVDQQSWDPSVKALTQFPLVLDNLAHNLSWTSSLGQAFANQQADVMAAVQVMRAKAMAAGSLQSSSQVTVVQQSPSTIVIQPANPQVVYVPQYNPTVVYGAAVAVPFYVAPPVPVVAAGLYFGAGITVGATFGGGGWGGGFGWGWNSWNVNWGGWGGGGGGTVIYNHNTYINNRTWNNTNYNGYHPWGPGNNGYHPGTDTHYGPNGGYHPNGYYGPDGGWHNDKPGTNPHDQPNGGDNGNHGLIGGKGGVQHPAADYGNQRMQASNDRSNDRSNFGGDRDNSGRVNQPRSYMNGNGDRDRAAADRGRQSMHVQQPRSRPQHMSAPRNTGGGHRR